MSEKLTLLLSDPFGFARRAKERLVRLYKAHILKDEFSLAILRWFSDKGDETLRFSYPDLNKDSVVFDLGGYLGDFAHEIHQKYGCKVYLFEPHPEFYQKCLERFSGNNDIVPLNYGVSDVNGHFTLSDSVDGSSFLNPEHESASSVKCEVREFFSILSELNVDFVDLMKINIEGGEYPLLQYLADKGKLDLVGDYQIQFHNFIEDAHTKRESINSALQKTHRQTWCYKFVWENWQKA